MLYILLPVHSRIETTKLFIECLIKQTYSDYQLILIDDGSKDGTSDLVKSYLPNSIIINGKGSWWWSGSLQQGYTWLKSSKASKNDMTLIINDDVIIEQEFLEKGKYILEANKNSLLCAQAYSLQDKRLIDSGVHVNWKNFSFDQAKNSGKINCLSTRGLLLRVEDFINLNGFYPRMLPHYGSDYEFTIRAFNKGMNLITDPSFRLWVDEQATGYHALNNLFLADYFKYIFSKKNVNNPFYRANLVLLACPWKWKIQNIFRVWYLTFRNIFSKLFKKNINQS